MTSSVPVGMKVRAHGVGADWDPCGDRSTATCATSATRPAASPPSEERTAKNHCAAAHTVSARARWSTARGSRSAAARLDAVPSRTMVAGAAATPTAAARR